MPTSNQEIEQRIDEIKSLIRTLSRRLHKLKEQKASQGRVTDPTVLTEIEDIEAEIGELQAELEELKRQLKEPEPSPLPSGESPYRGLEFFDVEHAHLFFGREALTEKLVERVRENRFLAIIGPSGSGKSSVVRAGLLAQLEQNALSGSANWRVVTVTPTAHPLDSLAQGLRQVISDLGPSAIRKDLEINERGLYLLAQGAEPLLLLVDQFEELFTLCKDEEERVKYLDNLFYAVEREESALHLVLTMRADFYGKCVAHPQLAAHLEHSQVLIGPMSEKELRRAISAPAERAGLSLESGLADEILDDVRAQPGSLPLLQYALDQLWQTRKEDERLTLQAYRDIGKVQGALAQRADAIYESLNKNERAYARDMLLRLTELGQGTEDTRRRVPKSELDPSREDAPEREDAPDAATVGRDAPVRLWDTQSGEVLHTLSGKAPFLDVLFDPAGQIVAASDMNATVRLWDAASGEILHALDGVNRCDFSPDGALLACPDFDGGVGLWDVTDGEKRLTLTGDDQTLAQALFNPQGDRIAAGGEAALAMCGT